MWAPTSSKFLGWLLPWYSFARCSTVIGWGLRVLFDDGRLFRRLDAAHYSLLLLLGLCLITQVFRCRFQELLLKLLVFKFKVFSFEYICWLVPLAKPLSVFLVSDLTSFVLQSGHFQVLFKYGNLVQNLVFQLIVFNFHVLPCCFVVHRTTAQKTKTWPSIVWATILFLHLHNHSFLAVLSAHGRLLQLSLIYLVVSASHLWSFQLFRFTSSVLSTSSLALGGNRGLRSLL